MAMSDQFDPLGSSSPLIVYIDYKSPYAYLAVAPTYAMGRDLGIEIDWRPFTLDITSYLGSARLDISGKVAESQRSAGQWTKVKNAYHDVRRYGSLRNAIVRGTTKIWDSSLAGLAMLWAKEQGPTILRDYMAIIYERFWKRELDIEDRAVIEGVLKESGARLDGFREYAEGVGRDFYARIQREAFDAGIFGVPTYVVGREIFFGREHLPRIRWMLSGRSGEPPDIAYDDPSIENARPLQPRPKQLTVAIDFKSLQSYLAIEPTCSMADELGVEINWQPIVITSSRARIAAVPTATEDRATRHRRIRADYLDHDALRYAADRGLAIDRIDHSVDSTPAAIGLLWVQRNGPSKAQTYVTRMMHGYWREHVRIDDTTSIASVLDASGLSTRGYEDFVRSEGRTEFVRVETELSGRGAFEVPTYLTDDDLFLGRQHMPLIRKLLSGAK